VGPLQLSFPSLAQTSIYATVNTCSKNDCR